MPKQWHYVAGQRRREAVVDTSFKPPRVVRFVGYRDCIKCRQPHWSEDLRRNWMCTRCRWYADE